MALKKMPSATILVVEGKHADRPSFASGLQKKGFTVDVAQNGSDALARLPMTDPDLVVINAASLRSTGVRICQAVRAQTEKTPIILVLDEDKSVNDDVADAMLNLPFTVQKLANRIRPFLPGDGANVLHVGPIRLDMEHRRVRCLGRNARLTPRLISLLQMLMQHHGEVIDREELFKKVWETNYTGDTRTLDVHMSWLRKAIEEDPDHPRFLHTVRGVGYRLDV
jgi:DNA-binding response OmpR family regulator